MNQLINQTSFPPFFLFSFSLNLSSVSPTSNSRDSPLQLLVPFSSSLLAPCADSLLLFYLPEKRLSSLFLSALQSRDFTFRWLDSWITLCLLFTYVYVIHRLRDELLSRYDTAPIYRLFVTTATWIWYENPVRIYPGLDSIWDSK